LYLRGETGGDVRQLFRDLVDTADAVPGVLSAAGAMRLPTEITGPRVHVRTAGFPGHAASTATLRPITPDFFDTVGIPVIEGRAFSIEDGQAAPAVAIVNAAFVREVLAGGRAVGARLTTNIVKPTLTVVGVAGDVTPAGASDRPALYLPVDQLPPLDGSLLVRTAGEPRSIVPLLTARIRSIAPALALDRIRDVADLLDAGRAVTRFNTRLAGAFAVLALLLAAIGVYGLTAGEVAARWRELAVRLALGASRREALWTVIRPGAAALAVGIFVGFAATLSAGPLIRSLLHGVEPTDPPTLLVVPVLLSSVGIVAASLAAARVLRADPAATLRGE